MVLTVDLLLMVLAIICFLLAAAGVNSGKLGLVPLGLMFWAIAVAV